MDEKTTKTPTDHREGKSELIGLVSVDFDKWWDENEAQYTSDSCHMSEYHMASVAWSAAIERCAGIAEEIRKELSLNEDYGGASYDDACEQILIKIRER